MVDINCKITLSVPALEKFEEILCKGIGKLYSPIDVRRMADAKAYEISAIGEALRKNVDIPAVYDNGNIMLDTKDFDGDELIKRTRQRVAYQELVRQRNIESVIKMAYKTLENEGNVIDEPVDEDWILRFFNSVQDVSGVELQRIWAAILAGEIKRPSSYSLRTLEALRNISKEEAELFHRIHKYIVKDGPNRYIPNDYNLLKYAQISYNDVLTLAECALINSDGNISITRNSKRESIIIAHNNKHAIIATRKNTHDIYLRVRAYSLTKVGCEIEGLLNTDADDTFFLMFAQEMKRQHHNFFLTMHEIKEITENGITCDDESDLLANVN